MLHTVHFTIKKLDRIPSVLQLSPAWLVSPQALFACIAATGHETHRSLPAPLVRYAFQDLEVAGCTYFAKKSTKAVDINLTTIKHNLRKSILVLKNALYLSVKVFSTKVLIGKLFQCLQLETGSPFYVVIRATRRSSHLQCKGSTFISQLF